MGRREADLRANGKARWGGSGKRECRQRAWRWRPEEESARRRRWERSARRSSRRRRPCSSLTVRGGRGLFGLRPLRRTWRVDAAAAADTKAPGGRWIMGVDCGATKQETTLSMQLDLRLEHLQ